MRQISMIRLIVWRPHKISGLARKLQPFLSIKLKSVRRSPVGRKVPRVTQVTASSTLQKFRTWTNHARQRTTFSNLLIEMIKWLNILFKRKMVSLMPYRANYTTKAQAHSGQMTTLNNQFCFTHGRDLSTTGSYPARTTLSRPSWKLSNSFKRVI